jgi:molybdenum cofactor cytidylyltransferase
MSIEFAVLAAGSATRMEGASKLGQQIGERNVIGKVIENLEVAGADKITVVYGDRWGLDDLSLPEHVRALRNENAEHGMGTSIALAVANMSSDTTRLLLALGDMPLVKSETLSLLIRESAHGDANIWAPTFQGKRGNPVVFAEAWFDDLSKLNSDQGGAMLFGYEGAKVAYIEVDDPGILIDIDTPADLSKVRANLKN